MRHAHQIYLRHQSQAQGNDADIVKAQGHKHRLGRVQRIHDRKTLSAQPTAMTLNDNSIRKAQRFQHRDTVINGEELKHKDRSHRLQSIRGIEPVCHKLDDELFIHAERRHGCKSEEDKSGTKGARRRWTRAIRSTINNPSSALLAEECALR